MDKKTSIVVFVVLLFTVSAAVGLKGRALIDWDEGVFAVQAQWLARGFTAGKPFNFQTPPLFQVIIAFFFMFFSDRDWVLPLLSVLSSGATVVVLYQFTRRLFDGMTGLFGVLLFMTTEYFLFFSRSGLSDAFFLFVFITGLFFFYLGITGHDNRSFLIAGACSVLALYTKYSGFLLPLVFLVIGFRHRRSVSWRWCLFTVMIPLLLFLPYVIVFFKAVSLPGIFTRHVSVAGIHHPEFLYYIARFSTVPAVLAAVGALILLAFPARHPTRQDDLKKAGIWFGIPVLIVFVLIGFYHPYFRLAYPLVLILCMAAAFVLNSAGRFKFYCLALCLSAAVASGYSTLSYRSAVPRQVAATAGREANLNKARYMFAITPPNVYFYVMGTILVPETNPSTKISSLAAVYAKNRMIMRRRDNALESEKTLLVLYSNVCTLAGFHEMIEQLGGRLIDSVEFKDAPVYCRDIFNPLRNERQIYELYAVDLEKITPLDRGRLWDLAFAPQVDVIRLAKQ
jgi:4-amino-4-deoxy-L-arabinose transferase-like glycosyltransferase